MKTITIGNTSFNIPTSWDEITLQQQLTVERLAVEHPEFKSLAVLAGYLQVEIDLIKKLHINDVKLLLNELIFTSTPIDNKTVTEFVHGEHTYHLIPSLLKAEFQDFLSIESIMDNYKGKEYQALPMIIAIIAKRKGESLSDYDVEERSKVFLSLPLPIANGIWFFFAQVGLMFSPDSHKIILQQQDQEIRWLITSMLATLKKPNGGGWLIRLWKVGLRTYLNYLLNGWKQSYGGQHLKAERTNWISRFKKLLKKNRKRS